MHEMHYMFGVHAMQALHGRRVVQMTKRHADELLEYSHLKVCELVSNAAYIHAVHVMHGELLSAPVTSAVHVVHGELLSAPVTSS